MDTSKVTRVEVIDWTKAMERGGGRVYTFPQQDNVIVETVLQDDERTLKILIKDKTQSNT